MKKIIFIAFLTLSLFVSAEKLTVAAFDVGSGTTKLVVATVDTELKTFEIIHENDVKVDFAGDLADRKSDVFSDAIREKGYQALQKLRLEAKEKGATRYFGVATEAFRKANNGQDLIREMNTKGLGITIQIISQQEEAKLGFLAACHGENSRRDKVIVWDIGGGSMQFSYTDFNAKFKTYGEKKGAVWFANFIKEIQGKPDASSPNPISEVEAEKARFKNMERIRETFGKTIPQDLLDKIHAGAQIIGIGGVHYYSIRKQINNESYEYNSEELDTTIGLNIGLTDHDIGGDYAKTQVSNLVMVQSYMHALNIVSIKTKKINLAHGCMTMVIKSDQPVRMADELGNIWEYNNGVGKMVVNNTSNGPAIETVPDETAPEKPASKPKEPPSLTVVLLVAVLAVLLCIVIKHPPF